MTLLTSQVLHADENSVEAIRKTLEAYALGTEQQDAAVLDDSFHPQFRVVAKTVDGLRVIEKAAYLGLIKDKKIGGQHRELEVTALNAGDDIAQVQLTLTGEKATFHDHLELVNTNGQWQILHNLTLIKPSL